MSQVLCAAPLVCLQVDSGRRNISYLTPDEELLERLRKDRPQHATGPVCATSSTTRQTAQRERNPGTRTRAEPKQCCAGNIMAPDPAASTDDVSFLPLTGLPMSTSKLQAAASENRFLLGDNDLLWMAQDFQPNIHIDDIHYDLSWPRQHQGDL